MSNKITVYVVYLNGDGFHKMMYGEYQAAQECLKELEEYNLRDRVEIQIEKFPESEIYYIGEHPEYGPMYSKEFNQQGNLK